MKEQLLSKFIEDVHKGSEPRASVTELGSDSWAPPHLPHCHAHAGQPCCARVSCLTWLPGGLALPLARKYLDIKHHSPLPPTAACPGPHTLQVPDIHQRGLHLSHALTAPVSGLRRTSCTSCRGSNDRLRPPSRSPRKAAAEQQGNELVCTD